MSVLALIACVLLFLAAFDFHIGRWPGFSFGWLGLAFWCLASLVPKGAPWVLPFFGLEWVLIAALVVVIIALLVRPRGP